jgi:hypothetical protein
MPQAKVEAGEDAELSEIIKMEQNDLVAFCLTANAPTRQSEFFNLKPSAHYWSKF